VTDPLITQLAAGFSRGEPGQAGSALRADGGLMASSRASVVSSYTIIKGALIEETYTVFRDWDFAKSPEENLDLVRRTNSVGAKSASWLVDIYKVSASALRPRRSRPQPG
jgi:hypothetical protein